MCFREKRYIILNAINGQYLEEGNEEYGLKNYCIDYG